MGAFHHMSAICSRSGKWDLLSLARYFGYPESSLCVLSGDIARLESEFPDTYVNLLSCKHNMDNRPPEEYGRDLVASWIFEDVIVRHLRDEGLDISGADGRFELYEDEGDNYDYEKGMYSRITKESVIAL